MIHTAQEITDIANQIKARIEKEYNTKLDHTIIGAVYDEEDQYWIAIGSYELLGEKESFCLWRGALKARSPENTGLFFRLLFVQQRGVNPWNARIA